MLIPFSDLTKYISAAVTGVLHIGAHECEELQAYNSVGSYAK